MGKILFISDLHFGHQNALAYDNREFESIEEHDEALVRIWNETVDIDDTVWILGDISWYNSTKTIEIFNRLNGVKNLCIGNHDKKLLRNVAVRRLFNEIVDYKELNFDDNLQVILSHYPIPCFNRHFYGSVHLYGHVHSSFEWNMMEQVKYQMEALYDKPCKMYNVGCMMPYIKYKPLTVEDIIKSYDEYKNTIKLGTAIVLDK